MDQTEKYFENFIDLFSHPGWKQYVEETQAYFDEANNLMGAGSAEEFWFNKGRSQELLNTINFELQTRNILEDMERERENSDA